MGVATIALLAVPLVEMQGLLATAERLVATEDALRQIDARADRLIELAQDAVFQTDEAFRVTDVNNYIITNHGDAVAWQWMIPISRR
jgi:PAS domain-containing protein